ncbi:MAG: acireductone synthase [Myxococcota bacterium]
MAKVILTDIEGTTSSIAFVKETLFPYARARIGAFVRAHADVPEVADHLVATRGDDALDLDGVVHRLETWIDDDKKATPLKALQGLIWRDGYLQGDYQGHVYADAVAGLRRWHQQGHALYIYSSGSVPAQKLLFGHSVAGDLTPLFTGYFDTRVGPKKEAESYRKIVGQIEEEPSDILFLSDVTAELDAAQQAGLATIRLVRPADGTIPGSSHREVASFDEIEP